MEKALEKALPRVYTEQYKLEAIKLAEQMGPNQACQRLGIPKGTLSYWLNAHLKMDVEILKKAAAYFAKVSK